MKKLLYIALALMLFSGCTKESEKPVGTEPTTQMQTAAAETTTAEPVRPVDSPEAFLDFDIFVDVPKESESVSYSVLNGNTAQIDFIYKETQYTLRATHGKDDLTFDVDEEYKDVMDSIDNGTRKAEIRSTVGDCRVAQWENEGANIVLMSRQPVNKEEFTKLCTWIAFPD